MSTPAPPPDGLSAASAGLWARILGEYELASAPALALLESALRSLDVAEAARAVLAVEGLMVKGKVHPLTTVHRDARAAFMTTMRVLGFPSEARE